MDRIDRLLTGAYKTCLSNAQTSLGRGQAMFARCLPDVCHGAVLRYTLTK
ncbi:MAG: hypothetical protein N838_04170 [Thiohalocapsa sp. PB-PSB1]|nr:MAG: hypothetical protein N838_04170 [Thiohalocapsa sp. PB-PSB1]